MSSENKSERAEYHLFVVLAVQHVRQSLCVERDLDRVNLTTTDNTHRVCTHITSVAAADVCQLH